MANGCVTVKGQDQATGTTFVHQLNGNDAFAWDIDKINDGYPILTWQGGFDVAYWITEQPEDVEAAERAVVSFGVEDTDQAASYQWQYSKDDGQTWADSAIDSFDTNEFIWRLYPWRAERIYRCYIEYSDGTFDYTDNASATVKEYEVFVQQPEKEQTAFIGDTVALSVEVNPEVIAEPVYVWQYSSDGGDTWQATGLTGKGTDTLSFKVTAARAANKYRCKVGVVDGVYVYSDAASVVLDENYVITEQPESTSAAVGETVSFTVQTNDVTASYQWEYSADGQTWQPTGLSGNATKTLSFKVTAARAANQYRCAVTFTGAAEPVYTDVVSVTTD